jgi:hypothetical protein
MEIVDLTGISRRKIKMVPVSVDRYSFKWRQQVHFELLSGMSFALTENISLTVKRNKWASLLKIGTLLISRGKSV